MTEQQGLQMKYFILKPKGSDAYARASRQAMREYANEIMNENLQLANELQEWADREFQAVKDKDED